MLIFAFTDTHGSREALRHARIQSKKADLVICTGDITVFENDMKRVVKEINNIGKKVLLVNGNHEDDRLLAAECEGKENIIFLHKQFYELGDMLFAGYGGGGFAMRDREFEQFTRKIHDKRQGKKLVMLFHGPPHKNKLDYLWGEHVGNKSYTDFIKNEKPDLVLCGHLHENFGKHDRLGKTLIMNPGPHGRLIKIK